MPKRSQGPSKQQRYEVLYEEMNSKLDLLLEKYEQLQGEVQRGFQELRAEMNGRFSVVEQALKEVSQGLQDHLKAHAT